MWRRNKPRPNKIKMLVSVKNVFDLDGLIGKVTGKHLDG